jgi:hypothetical protein
MSQPIFMHDTYCLHNLFHQTDKLFQSPSYIFSPSIFDDERKIGRNWIHENKLRIIAN